MHRISKHITFEDRDSDKLISINENYPISLDTWNLITAHVIENSEIKFIFEKLHVNHLIMLLTQIVQLPRNLYFHSVIDDKGKSIYLGDIIYNIELGNKNVSLNPLANKYSLKQFLKNIYPMKPTAPSKIPHLAKRLLQYIHFVYFIYYNIHAELLEFTKLFRKLESQDSHAIKDLEILETITFHIFENIFKIYSKNKDLEDDIDEHFLYNLFNGIERGVNFVNTIEDIAINVDNNIRKMKSSKLPYILLNRLQLFDGYRQMIEKRVDESRQLKYIFSKNSWEMGDEYLEWFENIFKKNIGFDLEIKLYEQFFDQKPIYQGQRKKSGTVMLFDFDNFIPA